jgi:branched-chain amino acid aminotransferase
VTLQASDVIWMDGSLVPWGDSTVHVMVPTLHYGWGVFEGIRSYGSDFGPALFRPAEHLERMARSAKIFHMDLGYSRDELLSAVVSVVAANRLTSCYVRPIAYLGYGDIGLNHLRSTVHVAIAAWPWKDYLGPDASARGCRVCVSSWRHLSSDAIPPTGKGTGQYVNSSLAKIEAVKAGYDEAILLNGHGNVVQGTAENIFVVRDNSLVTPPTSEGLLAGITRDTVMTLARDAGLAVMERALDRTDVYFADEAFLTGTAAEIVPIVEIDDRAVGSGEPGPVTKLLIGEYRAVTARKRDAYCDWLVPVSGQPATIPAL